MYLSYVDILKISLLVRGSVEDIAAIEIIYARLSIDSLASVLFLPWLLSVTLHVATTVGGGDVAVGEGDEAVGVGVTVCAFPSPFV